MFILQFILVALKVYNIILDKFKYLNQTHSCAGSNLKPTTINMIVYNNVYPNEKINNVYFARGTYLSN